MERIRVVNWEKFQHYGARRAPPWIRVYNSLIDKYEWGRLSDASKAHLIGIFLLASRYQNSIPADARFIADRIQAKTPIDLDELMAQGFIEHCPEVEETLAPCGQNASPEERRTEEIRGEGERRSAVRTASFGTERCSFREPTPGEVQSYAESVGYPGIVPEDFLARYRAVGWKLGRTPVTDWRPLVIRWRERARATSVAGRGALEVGRGLMIDLAVEEGLIKDDGDRGGGDRNAAHPLLPELA